MRTEVAFSFLGNRKRNREWKSDISYSYLGLWIRHVLFWVLGQRLIIHSVNLSRLANGRGRCYLATDSGFCKHNATSNFPRPKPRQVGNNTELEQANSRAEL